MKRLNNYILAFAISFVLFVGLNQASLIDSIVAVTFILSTLSFIFTTEEKPKREGDLRMPEVHYYHRSRINLYGYLMASAGVGTSFVFYLATVNNSVRLGVLIMFLWTALIAFSIWATKYTAETMYADAVSDYLIRLLKAKRDEYTSIDGLVRALLKSHKMSEKSLKDVARHNSFYTSLSKKEQKSVIAKFMDYVERTSAPEQELVSDEIKELNKGK